MTVGDGRWPVLPLDGKRHDRSRFSCGAPELDRYIQVQASQDIRRDVAKVFVAPDRAGDSILGYYSISAASFLKDGLPEKLARKLPHYPVPAALLGRLAIDDRAKGQGLGAHLLMDALSRVYSASQTLAVAAVVVEARDQSAAAFYRKYGFIPFVKDEKRLFLPMATVKALFEA